MSHFKSLNIKKTMTYDFGNSGPVLGLAQRCVGFTAVNRIQTLPFLIIGSTTVMQI